MKYKVPIFLWFVENSHLLTQKLRKKASKTKNNKKRDIKINLSDRIRTYEIVRFNRLAI